MQMYDIAIYLLTAGGITFFIALLIYYYEFMQYLYRRDMNLKDSAKEAREREVRHDIQNS